MYTVQPLRDVIADIKYEETEYKRNICHIEVSIGTKTKTFGTLEELETAFADAMDTLTYYIWEYDDFVIYINM